MSTLQRLFAGAVIALNLLNGNAARAGSLELALEPVEFTGRPFT